jgi:hypothetical protein
MHIETFTHSLGAGWSIALPSELDSALTLVVVFAAPEYAGTLAALAEIAAAFPASSIVGCSSAGEIHGPLVADGTLVVAVARFEHTALEVASTPIEFAEDSAAAGPVWERASHRRRRSSSLSCATACRLTAQTWSADSQARCRPAR